MTMQDKKPTYIEGVGWRYETDHIMTRRMEEHDYQSRCIYMITITTEGRSTILGTLQWTHGDPKRAHVERTPIGDEVAKCWDIIPSFYEGPGNTTWSTFYRSPTGVDTCGRTIM